MGLFEKLFPKETKPQEEYWYRHNDTFRLLTAYEPIFHDYYGSIYESELVRSAIESKARHISKLKVELQGSAQPSLKAKIKHQPNEWMTWPQFLARCSTILDCTNNLFILPVQNKYFETIGFFPVLPDKVKLVEYKGKLWVRYTFRNNKTGAVEFDRCAYLNKHQYKSDFFGANNHALNRTMDMISIQDQAIKEAVKNSATYRFIASVSNFTSPEDLKEERERFTRENLSGENGGLLLFPNTYTNVKQIEATPYTIDPKNSEIVKNNIYNYFGTNENIMQGKATSDELDAFFNSAVEPFAIALSEAMSHAIYTELERSYGNHVYVNANRLQYMSQTAKVQVARDLGDRGILTINEIRELFNYAPLPNGDVAYIRGEYKQVEESEVLDDGTDTNDEEEN